MTNAITDRKVTIIGAGLGGCLLAIYLAKRGFEVEVYERRGDSRCESAESGRSINMTLAERGLRALEAAGALDEVLKVTVPVKGRMVHAVDGSRIYQPYGKDDHEILHAIMRGDLNTTLLNIAESYPNVKTFFKTRCVSIGNRMGEAEFSDEVTGRQFTIDANRIIGADGTFSTVRQQMPRLNYRQEFLDHGYKELRIPPGPARAFNVKENALHVWPRGDRLLIAIPNRDHSFTCTCVLPYEGDPSFESIKTPRDAVEFFKSYFPDALPLIPDLGAAFTANKPANFITTYTSPWYCGDRIVLLGDACHSVLPFYGQGMNAAFEDCLVLSECIDRHGADWEGAFKEFQMARKPNTDVLAELSKENFVVLCKKAKSPLFIAYKKLDTLLSKLLPRVWVPLYTMISHTSMPYKEAVDRSRRQERIAKLLGMNVAILIIAAAIMAAKLVSTIASKLQGHLGSGLLDPPQVYRPAIVREEPMSGD